MPRKPTIKKNQASDLINLVKTLDKDSLLKLVDVLSNLKKVNDEPKVENQPKVKRGRPKKQKVVKVVDDEPEVDTVEEEIDDDQNDQPPQLMQPRKPRKLNAGGQKGTQARTEPFTAIKKRPNLFLKSKFANAHKNDTLIDKLLSKNRQPTERGVRNDLVEVECNICKKSYVINEDLVFIDPEEGPKYKCDKCANKKI